MGRPGRAERAGGERKNSACRDQGRSRGLRGPELKDFMQVCRLQAREKCLKQAIDQKIEGKDRREFVRSCAG
jgi:hypothetical protein